MLAPLLSHVLAQVSDKSAQSSKADAKPVELKEPEADSGACGPQPGSLRIFGSKSHRLGKQVKQVEGIVLNADDRAIAICRNHTRIIAGALARPELLGLCAVRLQAEAANADVRARKQACDCCPEAAELDTEAPEDHVNPKILTWTVTGSPENLDRKAHDVFSSAVAEGGRCR